MLGTPEAWDQYGGDLDKALDGPWAEFHNFVAGPPCELSTDRARTGSWSLKFPLYINTDSALTFARKVFRAALPTQGLALALWFDELPQANNMIGIRFCDFDNAEQVTLYIQSTGAISAYRGATLLGSTAVGAIVARAWNHIESKVTIDNISGAIEVRINEVTRLNLTGVDTQNTVNTELSQWWVGKLGQSDGMRMQADWYVDDIVPWDTATSADNTVDDFVGDVKVGVLYPTADTAQADWGKSTGVTGYSLLDETTPDDGDYIFTSTDGDQSDFALTALPGNTAEVIGYCALPRLYKTDAGSVSVAGQMVVSGTPTASDATPATTAATYWPFVTTVDPDTSAPYSAGSVPDLRLERVAA